jgi:hypothetical protein
VHLIAGLDDLEKRKLLTLPGLELRPVSRFTDFAIPDPILNVEKQSTHYPSFFQISYFVVKAA